MEFLDLLYLAVISFLVELRHRFSAQIAAVQAASGSGSGSGSGSCSGSGSDSGSGGLSQSKPAWVGSGVYHWTQGARAKKCVAPCSWSGN